MWIMKLNNPNSSNSQNGKIVDSDHQKDVYISAAVGCLGSLCHYGRCSANGHFSLSSLIEYHS